MEGRGSRSPASGSTNDSGEKTKRDRDGHRERRHGSYSKSSESRSDKDRSRRGERSSKRRDRSRHRSSDRYDKRSHESRSHHERRKKNRDDDGHRRSHRSRSRSSYENHDSRRTRRSRSRSSPHRSSHGRDRKRESNRSRSRSYERSSRHNSPSWEQEQERNNMVKDNNCTSLTKEELDQITLEAVREVRENRFDANQVLQGLMNNSSQTTKNFAALFNNPNSNDSNSNGPSENSQDGTERKRRKKSRWGGTEHDKTFIPGMPTILPSTLDPTQQEAYLVQLQIEEISRKLRTGELGIPQNPEERSPSPEPIYSSDGKRLNTREFRYRKKLEEQRHNLIQKMNTVNPDFKPPADYKPPITRVIDKVLIPQEQHPDINFVGLLIGPRGNTLKAMEKETGAKIIIRGKGSVKEGKVGRKDGQPLAGEDEPLHAFITAANPEAVQKAVDKIKDIIRQGIEVPEGHNDLRRMQLRELAQLNGTLRETDCPRCTNCGSIEHKSWLCPDKPNVTNNIICIICGGIGHISKDCRSKRPGATDAENTEDTQAKIDEEYMSLMAELGEGPPASAQANQKANNDPLTQVHISRGYSIFDKKPLNPPPLMQGTAGATVPTTAMVVPTTIPPPLASLPPVGALLPTAAAANVTAPPPPIPSAWGAAVPPGITPPMVIPPLVPPPRPLSSSKIMPLPWMNAGQPPPPGGDLPPPPGTIPLSPPSSTQNSVIGGMIPPWGVPPASNLLAAPNLCPWMGPPTTPYIQPPPPPPCIPPPPGIGALPQPPPPPPPLT